MAENILLKTNFLCRPNFQQLSLFDTAVMSAIITNPFCGKSGIFRLFAANLALLTGKHKYLFSEDLTEIEKRTLEIEDEARKARETKSLREYYATNRVKDSFQRLSDLGLIQYDFENHIVRIVEFHKRYCPLGQAKAEIISDALVKEQENLPHEFWLDYWEENSDEIKEFLGRAERAAEKSKSPRTILSSPSFRKIKKDLLMQQ